MNLITSEAGAEKWWHCPSNFSSCYCLNDTDKQVTKSQAESACASMGGHVLATETMEENNYIYDLLYQKGRATQYHKICH